MEDKLRGGPKIAEECRAGSPVKSSYSIPDREEASAVKSLNPVADKSRT